MNDLIESIFTGFTVGGVNIPVKFLYYHGHGEPYITYLEMSIDNTLDADNDVQNYVAHYYFDVYAKGNFLAILNAVKKKLRENGFTWTPSFSSADMYEPETGYYHKTICFSYPVTETNESE